MLQNVTFSLTRAERGYLDPCLTRQTGPVTRSTDSKTKAASYKWLVLQRTLSLSDLSSLPAKSSAAARLAPPALSVQSQSPPDRALSVGATAPPSPV